MLQFTLLDSLVSVLSLFLCLPSARHAISRTRNDHKSPKEASGLHAKTPQRKVAMEMPKSREEWRRGENCIVADYIRERWDTRFACECVGYVWTVWKIKGANRQSKFLTQMPRSFFRVVKTEWDKFRRFRWHLLTRKMEKCQSQKYGTQIRHWNPLSRVSMHFVTELAQLSIGTININIATV